ncbi:MAG: hypothetical protein Q9187_005711 [Circinaria calcarea]
MPSSPEESSSKGVCQFEVAVQTSEDVGSVLSLNEVPDGFHEVHHPSALYDVQPSAVLSPVSDLYAPRDTLQRVEGSPSALATSTHTGTFASENIEKPEFAERRYKLAVVNDGEKNCFAVILTRDMLAQFKNMCSIIAEVESLNEQHVISTSRAHKERVHVQRLIELDDATEGATVQLENEKEIERAQMEFERVTNERDLFGKYLNDEKQRLFACQETILSSMRTTLTEGGLLNHDKDSGKERNDDDSEKKSKDDDSEKERNNHDSERERNDHDSEKDGVEPHRYNHTDSSRTSSTRSLRGDDDSEGEDLALYTYEHFLAEVQKADSPPVLSDGSFSTPEVRHRRAITGKCRDTEMRLNTLKRELEYGWLMDSRKAIDFQMTVAGGVRSVSRSEIDKQDLLYKRELTRKILEVEDEHNKALAEKMALSIASNDVKLNNAMKMGDERVQLLGCGIWRSSVEAWLHEVTGGKEQEAPEYSLEDTMWKVKTVDFGESHSCLDMEAVCARKIEEYREECEKLREGVNLHKMSSEAGLPVSGNTSE